MHHATLICKLELGLWSQRFTDPVIKLISPKQAAGDAEVVNGFSLYLRILMSLYQFYIHHSKKMEGTVHVGARVARHRGCGPSWHSAVTAIHRVVHHQSTEGPGSPYHLAALPSQAQSHLSGAPEKATLWDGMIKLLQWQQQVMSHSSQNAAVSEEQHCQTTELAGEGSRLQF